MFHVGGWVPEACLLYHYDREDTTPMTVTYDGDN